MPVETFDERFTTTLAASGPSSRAPEDARAAAHLLESYLTWTTGPVRPPRRGGRATAAAGQVARRRASRRLSWSASSALAALARA